jgi:hypothetical protein
MRSKSARAELLDFFRERSEEVFFSRQLEVLFEDRYFHWITNRALRNLIADGHLKSEWRNLQSGNGVRLLWDKSFRYYKRSATEIISLVEEYSHPNVTSALGLHGEMMVLSGFAEIEFVQKGRNINIYGSNQWEESEHNLDFVFERDGIGYGVEVKNTLGYIDKKELDIKVKLCAHLRLKPVFVVRMIPRVWISELSEIGGFALIMKYQLYHWTHKELADRISKRLGLPVDAPRKLQNQTMRRFLMWHERQIV